MKKLIFPLIAALTILSCTKDLPEGIKIYVDITDVSVSENGFWTNDPSLIYKYYDVTISRAKLKNALITENPNYANYIIKLNSIEAYKYNKYEYRNGRGYYLKSISVNSKADLYHNNGTLINSKMNTFTENDELKFDAESNQYYVNETYKNYYDLISKLAYYNTNSFINNINDYEGF